MINSKQAKNIQKKLRLARATTGRESEKHYADVEKLVLKYGINIPAFNQTESFGNTVDYVSKNYVEGFSKRKIFYAFNEWNGWRFYWKAITRLDYRSLYSHIKRNYFSK